MAKTLRDGLVDACAAVRMGDASLQLRTALAVAGVLANFPLGLNTPEGELVYTRLRSVCSQEERETVLRSAEEVMAGDEEGIETVRELLGLHLPTWAPGIGPD